VCDSKRAIVGSYCSLSEAHFKSECEILMEELTTSESVSEHECETIFGAGDGVVQCGTLEFNWV
jgi:hypothetical protein